MKNRFLAMTLVMLTLIMLVLPGCGSKKESVLIYTSVEDYIIEDMSARLKEEFPEY